MADQIDTTPQLAKHCDREKRLSAFANCYRKDSAQSAISPPAYAHLTDSSKDAPEMVATSSSGYNRSITGHGANPGMKLLAFEAVAKALDRERVRYLVAGGLAVNAHGYIRLTMDIDVVIALDSDNIQRAFRALSGLDYRPTVPIGVEDFSRPEKRDQWRREKGMQVLNFQSGFLRDSNRKANSSA